MKIKIVYFAYLIPNKWEAIVNEQLSSLKKLSLYDEAINIYMTVISDNNELQKLIILLNNEYPKVEIKNIYQDNIYEFAGMQTIYQVAEDDDDIIFLYFHSKGMTSNQHDTRQYLFKYTINNYQQYINEFQNNKHLEIAGMIPHINGFIFFNFFWIRSSYVRNYCSKPIISDNRYIWEVWIGNEFSRKKEIITWSPIIKYDRIQHHHEVWSIHDKIIQDHYCYLLDDNNTKNNIPKPVKIDSKDNNIPKPVKIDSKNNNIPKPVKIDSKDNNIPKPVKIDSKDNNIPKPVKIDSKNNNIPKPVKIDSKDNNIPKPVKIDSKDNNIPKPVKIDSKNNNIQKPVKIDSKDNNIPKLYDDNDSNNLQYNLDTKLYELNSINPYAIFENLKNKNNIVVELGSNIGLNTCMLSKRFKKVIAVENNKNNFERLESNIRKYCYKNISLCNKNIVQIKNNLNDDITIKELLYYNIHKNFQNISLIVCDLQGNEEIILEDLFHYAFHSKIPIFIKIIKENWINKDINRFNYLFEFYKYNHKLLNSKDWIFFEPIKDINLQLIKNNMSVVIIGYNQFTYISKMVKQVEQYTNDIIIIDNNSNYDPLLNYYNTDYKYSLLKMDKNYGHKVYETSFIVSLLGNIHIITDPDLKFNSNLPKNFIGEMIKISNDYKAGRVGFALLIDVDDIRKELSYAGMPIKEWEGRFWKNIINHPYLKLYGAPIDTTFCLLNTLHNSNGLSIRIGDSYICKHLPWHINYWSELLDDEYDHYLINNKSSNYWIDKMKKKTEPFTRITIDGIEDETSDSNEDETSDSIEDKTSNSNKDETSDSIEDKTSNSNEDETSDSIEDETSDSNEDETSDSIEDDTSDGIKDETSDGIKDETSDGIKDETSDGINKIEDKIEYEIIFKDDIEYDIDKITKTNTEIADWIIDKVKNNKLIAINIGLKNIDKFTNNFKFILNIDNETTSLGSNVLNFSDKIVDIKKSKGTTTWKQFIYDNMIYKQDLKEKINFINISYNGQEEYIIEDLLYYCWINLCNINIQFSINNWINKDIKRYEYLFEFFNCYLDNIIIDNLVEYLIENVNANILLIPKNNLSKELFKKNMTCVIIGYNQPTYIKNMVKQLEKYTNDIVIIDNDSNFKPLIEYYGKEYPYTLLKMKSNLGHKVYEKSFMEKIIGDVFILTDPDLEFNKKLPDNFIENIIKISTYYQAEKVGFALLYDAPDIRTDIKAFGKSIKEWEKQYWTYKFYYPDHEIWSAALDTTFCLINKQNKGGHYRIAGNYLCKHLPWHIGFEKQIPKDEFDNYMNKNVSTNYWKK
jgi:hypothetical protein